MITTQSSTKLPGEKKFRMSPWNASRCTIKKTDRPGVERQTRTDEPSRPDEANRIRQTSEPGAWIHQRKFQEEEARDDFTPNREQVLRHRASASRAFDEHLGADIEQPTQAKLIDERANLLGRAIRIGITGRELRGDFADRTLSVQQADEIGLFRLEPKISERERILDHIVLGKLEHLAPNDQVGAQRRRNQPGKLLVIRSCPTRDSRLNPILIVHLEATRYSSADSIPPPTEYSI